MSDSRIEGFEHLHLHTDFSLLDGYGTVEEYAVRAPKINQRFLCVTDHGMMGVIPRQISACEKNGVQPIYGCELYCNPNQMEVEDGKSTGDYVKLMSEDDKRAIRPSYHLIAIAYNETGYSNLVRLHSWAWTKGFYRRPRVNHEQLLKHKEGIIFTSTCYIGEVAQAFDRDGPEAAEAKLKQYMDMFHDGEHFFLEFILLDFVKQKPYNAWLATMWEKYGVEPIVTCDTHYCLKDDAEMQRKMLMINTGNTVQDIERAIAEGRADEYFELQDQNLWMKSEEEINDIWERKYSDVMSYDLLAQAKRNTVKICEMAKGVELDRSVKLPIFDNQNERLKEMVMQGFFNRKLPKTQKYVDRIKEEYSLICEKDFSSYFIIQKMMTDEARRWWAEKTSDKFGADAVGPGRGCLAGWVPVVMGDGSCKAIEEVREGDWTWARSGELKQVKNLQQYPLADEPLLKIMTYFGDNVGVSLTFDHEVLAEPGRRPKGWEPWAESTKKSRRHWEEPVGDLRWIPAGDIKIGDWLFVPIPKVNVQDDLTVDFSQFCDGGNLYCEDDYVFHKHINIPTKKIDRHWRLTPEWAYALGVFAGDGWLRSDGRHEVAFCFNSETELRTKQRIKDLFAKQGVGFYEEQEHRGKKVDVVVFQSPYHRQLFGNLFCRYDFSSSTKHVPDCVKFGDLRLVEAFVRGYFDADGHLDKHEVKFNALSSMLAQDIRFLLLRMQIPSSMVYECREETREEYKDALCSYAVRCPMDRRVCGEDSQKRYFYKAVDGGFLIKVLSLEEVEGEEFVYDIEVEGEHNYLTSSFVVHNSAVGSLVCFCLGITDVDPIAHNLLFSRFMSPARGGKAMKLRFTQQPLPIVA